MAATALILGAAGIAAALVLWPDIRPEQAAAEDERADMMARLLEDLAEMSDEEAFERPSGPWQLALPDDHGGHPAARVETWLISAHLEDEGGTPIGVTFSLSRFGLQAGEPSPGRSAWDLRAVYGAQVTLLRGGEVPPLSEQRLSRGAGAAGHDREAREVWLDNWQLSYGTAPDGGGLTLMASVEGQPIRLELTPVKAARPAGGDERTPIRGFAIPRMDVRGSVGFGTSETRVHGLAWVDKLWGELPLPGGPLAYDRMILQLDDGTDVSLLRSRRRDGRGSSTLDGVIVYPGGDVETLTEEVLDMAALEHWRPEGGGPPFPVEWQLADAGFELRITPLAENRLQGLLVGGRNVIVAVSGHRDGTELRGLGTLQLTGNEAP
jgi:predicted secreted hydrolase